MRPLSEIARDASTDMYDQGGQLKFYAAWPYLHAMLDLHSIHDMYGADSAKSVVLYFLSNAATWKGEKARRIKAELKEMVK